MMAWDTLLTFHEAVEHLDDRPSRARAPPPSRKLVTSVIRFQAERGASGLGSRGLSAPILASLDAFGARPGSRPGSARPAKRHGTRAGLGPARGSQRRQRPRALSNRTAAARGPATAPHPDPRPAAAASLRRGGAVSHPPIDFARSPSRPRSIASASPLRQDSCHPVDQAVSELGPCWGLTLDAWPSRVAAGADVAVVGSLDFRQSCRTPRDRSRC